jgi:N-acetylmuramoyl-L-alanine amidase
MKRFLGLVVLTGMLVAVTPVLAQSTVSSLYIAYPPPKHQTTAEKIFLVGSAPANGEVTVNGNPVSRSKAGHFAPSFPLAIGVNQFQIRYRDKQLNITVTRNETEPEIPTNAAFAAASSTPAVDIAKLPEELICFGAIAPPEAKVTVRLGNQTVALLPQASLSQLPPNSAILNAQNQPTASDNTGRYEGCTTFATVGDLGKPLFELNFKGQTITQAGTGSVNILSAQNLEVVEVTAEAGVTRTGASTDYSRLTPLPKGTRAAVTGKEGEWLRLDYGAWIKAAETKMVAGNVPPRSPIRSISSRQVPGATEIIFPLQVPVPVAVRQGNNEFTLTLYNTTAQTDTIRLDEDPIIDRLDWQQVSPTQIDYTFQLKNQQQWGYDLRYQGTSLVLTLRHPPQALDSQLKGIKILLDPGHGGSESGAKGPTGYPEKAANLVTSRLLADELKQLGATVYLTRETDIDLSLEDRVKEIDKIKPDLAISIHYNALPDGGDAMNTKGISTFWYHPQAHNFALFIHDYLIENLHRSDAGTFWNNLALTRPHTAPSVLLELGYAINPEEFEWITNPEEQKKLAKSIALGINEWFAKYSKL